MSGRLVMGYWDCPYCGTRKIKGTYKDCQYCGAPRDKDTKFYMDGEVEYLTEEEAELKGKGADWHCAYCDSLESVLNSTCQHCGATREDSSKNYFQIQEEKRKKKLEEEAYQRSLHEESYVEEPSYKESYTNDDYEYHNDYDSESSYETNNSDDSYDSSYSLDNNSDNSGLKNMMSAVGGFLYNWGPKIAAGIAGVLLIIGLIWLLIPKPKTVEITEMSWSNSISIESYETVRESDWSVPSGGRIAYTQEEFHHYEQVFSHYETKTRTYTEQVFSHYDTSYSYSDNGDGTFTEHTHQTPVYETVTKTETYEEPVYVDVPVYQTKYYYDIEKWTYKRSVKTSGTDKNPYWGDVVLADNEREGGRSSSYYISGFETKDEEKEIQKFNTPENIWSDLNVGDVVTFKVTFGTITELVE